MQKLTRQEIFNKALNGIRQQGHTRSYSEEIETCAYRGYNDTKCAVGHCIDDETAKRWDQMNAEIGDSTISYIATTDAERFNSIFNISDITFLTDLQRVHDMFVSPADFESEMRALAQKYDLEFDVPTIGV